MRIVALGLVAELGDELLLHAAVALDLFVGELDGLEHVVLADLVHLTLDHHDVLLGGGDHQFEIAVGHLGEAGVNDEFAIDAGHADFRDRAAERQVGSGEGCGSSQAGECIGLGVLVSGDKAEVDEHLEVEIVRPERPDGTVDKTGDEDLVVRGLALALHEAAGIPSRGEILLTVVHREGHEIGALLDFLGCADGGEDHGASHLHDSRTVRLLGEFSGLDLDHAAVRELDLFRDNVHYCFLYVFITAGKRTVRVPDLSKKRGGLPMESFPLVFLCRLSTETELLDNASVSLDVDLLEIVQDLTSLTDETEKGTTRDNVLLVLLHMLGKVSDTVGK